MCVLMPPQLLPASAAAFAPRASSVNVVLSSRVEPWLTVTLKRVNRVKRPLNNVTQHQRCLTETLSLPTAIWTLTSLMLPKAPESKLSKDSDHIVAALLNYQLIHIEAYIVHVDMVLRNEVAFKLTPDSIESLIEYHENVHCVDISANKNNWSEKEAQIKKLHEGFIQAINKFVYGTHVSALEGLEEDGLGELLRGKSEEVKNNILNLFHPLLPPPPRIVEDVRPRRLLPASTAEASSVAGDGRSVLPSHITSTGSNSLLANMALHNQLCSSNIMPFSIIEFLSTPQDDPNIPWPPQAMWWCNTAANIEYEECNGARALMNYTTSWHGYR